MSFYNPASTHETMLAKIFNNIFVETAICFPSTLACFTWVTGYFKIKKKDKCATTDVLRASSQVHLREMLYDL